MKIGLVVVILFFTIYILFGVMLDLITGHEKRGTIILIGTIALGVVVYALVSQN